MSETVCSAQLFCDGERLKVKEAAPEAKFGELMSLLAAKWKEVSDADKERFEKMHEVRHLVAILLKSVSNKGLPCFRT